MGVNLGSRMLLTSRTREKSSMNTISYEAFLPHHTASKHRVMAITHDVGQHTQLHAIATVSDALTARQLADALNSRLLDRRNHSARVDAALTGLSDSVRAAVTQLPIDPKHAHTGRTPLAAHIYTDPIDGILLFPTKACEPGQCQACTDCANDCRDCENCLPPGLTPRTAYALTVAGSILADTCYDAVDDGTRVPSAERIQLLPLPMALRAQDDEFIRRIARCFDDLTQDIEDGLTPQPCDLAEQLALQLMLDDAELLHADQEDFLAESTQELPVSRHDYDFATLYSVLFEDDDHAGLIGLSEPELPGALDFLFEPFIEDEVRDPERGFRR
jgi:hypothetical protein